jgi:hypothetical protein
MGIRVIHVLTHDSIGLGEDGPTHQPVEHMAALRAIPNLLMFRPADATETVECWQIALEHKHRPSGLALTRQNLIAARTDYEEKNLCSFGAYELVSASDAKVSIFASGSEVEIALKAQQMLAQKGISARVVSVPCFELFFEQPDAYRGAMIGSPPSTSPSNRHPPGGTRSSAQTAPHRREVLWRIGPPRTLQAFRHHPGSGRRRRRGEARPIGQIVAWAFPDAHSSHNLKL